MLKSSLFDFPVSSSQKTVVDIMLKCSSYHRHACFSFTQLGTNLAYGDLFDFPVSSCQKTWPFLVNLSHHIHCPLYAVVGVSVVSWYVSRIYGGGKSLEQSARGLEFKSPLGSRTKKLVDSGGNFYKQFCCIINAISTSFQPHINMISTPM